MNADIEKLKQWLCANKLTLNILKTEYMLIGSRQRIATVTESLDLSINGITSVCKKVSSGIGVIKKIKPFIPSRSLINIYQSSISTIVVLQKPNCKADRTIARLIVVLFGMALVRAWPKNSKSYKIAQHELSQAHITWHLQKTC